MRASSRCECMRAARGSHGSKTCLCLGRRTLGTAASLAMNLGSDERRCPTRHRTGASAGGAERERDPSNIGHGEEDNDFVRSWRERRCGGGSQGCRHLVHALARVSRGCFVVGLGYSRWLLSLHRAANSYKKRIGLSNEPPRWTERKQARLARRTGRNLELGSAYFLVGPS